MEQSSTGINRVTSDLGNTRALRRVPLAIAMQMLRSWRLATVGHPWFVGSLRTVRYLTQPDEANVLIQIIVFTT